MADQTNKNESAIENNKIKTPDALLDNILESCNIPPSSQSLEQIMTKRKLENKPIFILKMIGILFLIFVVITPLFFRGDPQFSLITKSRSVAVNTHTLYTDHFVMTLSGDVDYNNVYSTKNDGKVVFPDVIDTASGLIIFPYNGDALNIFIPTTRGECIQAVLNETN